MKKINKTIWVLFVLLLGLGGSANAQVLDWLNKAAETVNRASETYNNARNTYNNVRETFSTSSSESNNTSYTRVCSVRMKFWHAAGSGSASADIVVDNDGIKWIRMNGQNYNYYENGSYNEYLSDSNNPNYYRYYVYNNKRYYFNL